MIIRGSGVPLGGSQLRPRRTHCGCVVLDCFDDFPNLKIVIGHQGEGIPFGLWRVDARMRFFAAWFIVARGHLATTSWNIFT